MQSVSRLLSSQVSDRDSCLVYLQTFSFGHWHQWRMVIESSSSGLLLLLLLPLRMMTMMSKGIALGSSWIYRFTALHSLEIVFHQLLFSCKSKRKWIEQLLIILGALLAVGLRPPKPRIWITTKFIFRVIPDIIIYYISWISKRHWPTSSPPYSNPPDGEF